MKIVYIANIRFPTEKAHGIQIAKTCEALAALGHAVELLVTNRKTDIDEDAFTYYGVRENFSVSRVNVPDVVAFGKIAFFFESVVFALRVRKRMNSEKPDIVYGRDELVLSLLGRVPLAWETHTGTWNPFARYVSRRAKRIIAISEGLRTYYMRRGIPAERIAVAPDGIDIEQFSIAEDKRMARERLGIPQEETVALYAGRLDGWKGVETLFRAAALLPGIRVVVIGGEPKQIAGFRDLYPSILFLGQRPYTELSRNLSAADVLVLPNTGTDRVSAHFTSPLKLFAYMASGRPIVASDLPSIREVVDEHSAVLVAPDSPEALATGIRQALRSGEAISESARARVQAYSWKSRAERILTALST